MTILHKSLSAPRSPFPAAPRLSNRVVLDDRFCQSPRAIVAMMGLIFCMALVPSRSDAQANASSSPVGSFASSWSTQAGGARMRLISLPLSSGSKPRYEAAVEIKLPANAITYWREPGEAGVPPRSSFQGSENVAHANFLFPEPHRLNDDGIEAFGYRGGVTFPIRVTPVDASKPTRLSLTLDYAVCDRICVPVKGHAELLLPKFGMNPDGAVILASEAKVPQALPASTMGKEIEITREARQAKPQWRLIWRGDEPTTDLFAEGPEGWAFATRKTGENSYSIAAIEMPATAPATVSVKLTLTGPRPHEVVVPLALSPRSQ
jgi:DsbC/DsbD-like thiol-disulfide interchange protein